MTRPTKDALIEYLLCGNDHDDLANICAEMFGGSARAWAEANTSEAMAAEYVDRLDFAALTRLQDEVIEQIKALATTPQEIRDAAIAAMIAVLEATPVDDTSDIQALRDWCEEKLAF